MKSLPCKVLSISLLIVLLFAACKKESQPAVKATYNIVGTWDLTYYKTNFEFAVDASVAQYPCMAQCTDTFYPNGSFIINYVGSSNCIITPPGNSFTFAIGEVGNAPDTATWTLSADTLFLHYRNTSQVFFGVLSSSNGNLQAAFKDKITIAGAGPMDYSYSIIEKQ